MHICRRCKGHRIKTRTNKSFGKSYSTAVRCKDCGSTDIESIKSNNFRYRRR